MPPLIDPLIDGVRVLDVCGGLAGPYAAKLLADLGADVIKVEPPQGDPARRAGPFPSARPDPEASAPFLYANTSKRGVTLDLGGGDLGAGADRDRFLGLVTTAQVVIAGESEPALAARGIGLEALRRANPRIILVTATGFGGDGPYRDYAWTHLIGCAIGGWAHLCGDMAREPLQSGGALADTLLGAYTAVATLIALEGLERHGAGDHVDVSGFESMVTAALLVTQRYEYGGLVSNRLAEVGPSPSFLLPCGDGYIGANVLTDAQWRLMCAFFGQPDLADDPRLADSFDRMARGREIIEPLLEAAVRERSPEEVFHEAQSWRIPFGLVPTVAEAFELLPHQEREFFAAFDHPNAGRVRMPGMPFLIDGARPPSTRPPLLGEHNDEILGALPAASTMGAGTTGVVETAPASPEGAGKRPLEGMRIIDLSMFMSGPLATLCLSDAGADVIKVESLQRVDGWRAAGAGGEGAFWERSMAFNWVNRNKRDITLDLTDARGVALLKRLVADADAVVENYSPRVMGNFGLDYESLREVNPNIVLLSMPGFGLTGAWRDYVAFANTTEEMAAIPQITGYAGDRPIFTGTTGGDPLAGLMGGVALLAALQRKRRTGQGGHIDLSQTEAVTSYVGDVFTGYAISGEEPGLHGNFDPTMAPHGTYLCRDERWIAIAARDDADFRAIGRLMGRDDWARADGRLGSVEARLSALAELDAALAAWTRDQDAFELMSRLQEGRVPAAVVTTGKDLLEDPHLKAREFFVRQERAEVGSKRYPGSPYRFRDAEPPANQASPTLGQHNGEVLGGLLGLSDEELSALETDDVIGTVPLGARGD